MPSQPLSPNWFELPAEPIECPHCKRGRAVCVRGLPDPTRLNVELRTYSCPKCYAMTVKPIHLRKRGTNLN